MPLLRIRDVVKKFGGVRAVDHVSLELGERTISGIIGPNGSGKTTLLNLINGIYKPDQGEIYFKDEPIHDRPPHEIAEMGIGRTFQVPHVFRDLTVLKNMMIPTLCLPQNKWQEATKKALYWLEFLGLIHLKDEPASNLSGGQQMLLEVARALMLEPELVLLDEPFAAIHPELRGKLVDCFKKLKEDGKTFIIVSHHIPIVMDFCERVVVLHNGAVIADGKPEEVRYNERVIDAYLGE